MEYIQIEDDHFVIKNELYEKYRQELKKIGNQIDPKELHLSEDEPYLEEMIQAYLSSNLPDLGGEGFNGIVKVIRRSCDADDNDRYTDDETPNQDKEILLKYMDKEQFEDKVNELKNGYDESKYKDLRQYFTIDYDNGVTSSGEVGTSATGSYNGKDIIYDIGFARMTKTPEELGLKVSNTFSNVNTTAYCACEPENGVGNAGKTPCNIDLEPGRHIVAILDQKFGLNYGDWIYIKDKGYYLVCDVGQGFENRIDVFQGKEGDDLGIGQSKCPQYDDVIARGETFGTYHDIQVIKKADADEFISSGKTGSIQSTTSTSSGGGAGPTSMNSMIIKVPVYNGTSVSTEKIPYQQVTGKYSISIGMLFANLQASRNPEYISALCDLVNQNSKIDLVVQETGTKTETYTVTRSGETLKSKKETLGIIKYVREADTWIVNAKQEYFKNEDKSTVEQSHDENATSWTKVVTTKVSYKATPGSSDETRTSDEATLGGGSMDNNLPEGATKGIAQDIPDNIKQQMQGRTMIQNDNISFDDLQYLTIPYINFSGQRAVGHMVVNKSVADDVLDIFEELYNIKYPIEKMQLTDNYYKETRTDSDDHGSDNASVDDNNTSAFNYRMTSGAGTSGGLSPHGKGLAIDINPKINPFLPVSGGVPQPGSHSNASKYFDRSEENKNSLPSTEKAAFITENSEIVSIFRKHGWSWLITDTYWDTQHFEKLN